MRIYSTTTLDELIDAVHALAPEVGDAMRERVEDLRKLAQEGERVPELEEQISSLQGELAEAEHRILALEDDA